MSLTYEEAHRFADTQYPRDLWNRGQADLAKITDTFRSLAASARAVLRLNPSPKYPSPGRSLVKQVANSRVRIELVLTDPNQIPPDDPEQSQYELSVYRTPRQGFLQSLLHRHRRDPTEWHVVEVFTPEEVRNAAPGLREALQRVVRDEFAAGNS